MNNIVPPINPKEESQKIIDFIQQTLDKTIMQKIVIGLSGGIDSTTSLYLLAKSIQPSQIHAVYLPYEHISKQVRTITEEVRIPRENFQILSIKKPVDTLATELSIDSHDEIRLGNVMARVRMIALFDLAKKVNGLVAGTENKSEYYLGYFTRFGDEASDFEPIRHLYKTQIYELAKFLNVPKYVIEQVPTAGLWKGQTDEKEFGFSYEEADQVLYLFFEKKLKLEQIEKKGFKNAKKIIERAESNNYKHHTPYIIK